MYRVDIGNKTLIKLSPAQFGRLRLRERYDIQEWIENTPEIIGEELLIIYKELELPSRIRVDLLAIDKSANLVIIELKRDDSGPNVEWQAIKYASYCSQFLPEYVLEIYAEYLQSDVDDAHRRVEGFIDEEIDKLNQRQRIILIAKEFHSDVASAVLWLREYELNIECVKLTPYVDENNQLFITSDLIIPLPEAKEYVQQKETKQKEAKRTTRSSFSREKGDFPAEELETKLFATLTRRSELTPRVIAFLEIIASAERSFKREEIRSRLFEKGIGANIGQSGTYLSNISQFLTKRSNPHLRQVIDFDSGGTHGETKENYKVIPEYRQILGSVLEKVGSGADEDRDNTD